jgi:CubicO group peptidase (beta-lactamase class C family)
VGKGAFGISIAVAKDGVVVHEAAFGVGDPSNGRPTAPTDRYRLASNSKILTATVVMQLVEQGRLSLDSEVIPRLARKYGIEIKDPLARQVTVRHLLSHTSGFDAYHGTFFEHKADNCVEAAGRGITRLLNNPPGTRFTYSNMNFCLLGLLIADVTGTSYEKAVQSMLLEPLGITDMRLAGTHDVRPGEAHHPSVNGRNYMEVLEAAGAWVGTAADLVRIVDSLDPAKPGWHPVAAATFADMIAKPAVPFPRTSRWYGLGLRVWADGTWGHTGTVENARSMVLHQPNGITWAVLINGNVPSNTDRVRDYVAKAFEKAVESPDPVVTTTSTVAVTTAPTTSTTTTTVATTTTVRTTTAGTTTTIASTSSTAPIPTFAPVPTTWPPPTTLPRPTSTTAPPYRPSAGTAPG